MPNNISSPRAFYYINMPSRIDFLNLLCATYRVQVKLLSMMICKTLDILPAFFKHAKSSRLTEAQSSTKSKQCIVHYSRITHGQLTKRICVLIKT